VLSTVREAHDLDYSVVVVADACADPDAEVHDLLVTKIFPKQGRVISVSELSDLFA
jgi:nicotinamidase-related amidase